MCQNTASLSSNTSNVHTIKMFRIPRIMVYDHRNKTVAQLQLTLNIKNFTLSSVNEKMEADI